MSTSKLADILDKFTGNVESAAGVRRRTVGCVPAANVLHIPLGRIVPDENQPRQEFDQEELYRLAGSLKAKGQLQPVLVRYDEAGDRYVLIAGERRWRAAQLANLATLAAVVDDGGRGALELLEIQITENVARADLSPLELATVYRELMQARQWTAAQLAEALNVSPSTVSRTLACLKLAPGDQAKLAAGELSRNAAVGSTVKQSRPKRKPKATTIRTAAGRVTVEPKAGAAVVDVLRAALAQLDQAAAA